MVDEFPGSDKDLFWFVTFLEARHDEHGRLTISNEVRGAGPRSDLYGLWVRVVDVKSSHCHGDIGWTRRWSAVSPDAWDQALT